MAAKYYRVIKDHPMWEIGAVVSNAGDSSRYKLVSDIWLKDIEGITETWYQGAGLVENQPEWFERVYEMSAFGKAVYATKEKAREMAGKVFKDK